MPNRPISFEFVAETAQYLRETKNLAVSTEDLAEALVAVSDGGDDLERKLSRAMRDAASDVETLERAVRNIPDATDEAADRAARDFDRLGDEAREAGRETGESFRQSLGESLGSGGSLTDAVTDTLGEAVGSLGGAAGIAASALAGGALLIFNQVKKSWEATMQAISEQTESMWGSAIDSVKGKIGEVAISISQTALVQEEVNRLWRESSGDMQKLVEAGQELNINANDLVLARAGDEEALKRVRTAMADVYTEQNASMTLTQDQIKATGEIEGAIFRAGTATDQVNAKMKAYNDSIPEVARAIELMGRETADVAANIALWKTHAEEFSAAFRRLPTDLDVRLRVDASELRQYFPYGTVGGTSVYKAKP